ncbi:MAG: metallophosphoesterase family protein [Oceanobacter sp.]
MKLVHLSDLHFGREKPQLTINLLKVLKGIDPQAVMISGDVTQSASHSEYRRLRTFLERLEKPYLIVPGNHDIAGVQLFERFFYPWRKWKYYVSENLEPRMTLADARVLGINSARRLGCHRDWSRGRISSSQLAAMKTWFERVSPDALKVVVAHHPFWLPEEFEKKRGLIGNVNRAIKQLGESSVDLILGGHAHVVFAEVVNGMVVSHAGTSISNRRISGHPNSFNLIEGDSKRLEITEWQWFGKEFLPTYHHSFLKETSQNASGWKLQDKDSVIEKAVKSSSDSSQVPDGRNEYESNKRQVRE